uniref:Si:ch211-117l17.7 n=1 Tax=Cyprinus carpio TaxID=7962 RepID=A0A8C2FZT8_CYPCA
MWFTFVLLQLLPQLTLSAHCPSGCVCDIRGSAKCTGDITDIPPLNPTTTFLLQLNDTNIKVLKDRSFQPKLNYLNLADNQLRNLLKTLFHNLRQLKSLVLSSNQLETLESGSFDHLSNLLVLMLQKNQIREIPPRLFCLFCCLPKLKKLSLKNNDLGELDPELFSNLISVQILMLNENKLESLPSAIFRNTSSLEILDLNHNHLRHLPGDGSTDMHFSGPMPHCFLGHWCSPDCGQLIYVVSAS